MKLFIGLESFNRIKKLFYYRFEFINPLLMKLKSWVFPKVADKPIETETDPQAKPQVLEDAKADISKADTKKDA